ncbi:uncharacterized protein LOC136025375 isoform X2 [Artemia franciscana]|uniref:uncharacterized protein LOC136025375 isoform X2 n=1 Tax=Artemia franciscana TaxID=6661 RepID=UPI0032D9BDB7
MKVTVVLWILGIASAIENAYGARYILDKDSSGEPEALHHLSSVRRNLKSNPDIIEDTNSKKTLKRKNTLNTNESIKEGFKNAVFKKKPNRTESEELSKEEAAQSKETLDILNTIDSQKINSLRKKRPFTRPELSTKESGGTDYNKKNTIRNKESLNSFSEAEAFVSKKIDEAVNKPVTKKQKNRTKKGTTTSNYHSAETTTEMRINYSEETLKELNASLKYETVNTLEKKRPFLTLSPSTEESSNTNSGKRKHVKQPESLKPLNDTEDSKTNNTEEAKNKPVRKKQKNKNKKVTTVNNYQNPVGTTQHLRVTSDAFNPSVDSIIESVTKLLAKEISATEDPDISQYNIRKINNETQGTNKDELLESALNFKGVNNFETTITESVSTFQASDVPGEHNILSATLQPNMPDFDANYLGKLSTIDNKIFMNADVHDGRTFSSDGTPGLYYTTTTAVEELADNDYYSEILQAYTTQNPTAYFDGKTHLLDMEIKTTTYLPLANLNKEIEHADDKIGTTLEYENRVTQKYDMVEETEKQAIYNFGKTELPLKIMTNVGIPLKHQNGVFDSLEKQYYLPSSIENQWSDNIKFLEESETMTTVFPKSFGFNSIDTVVSEKEFIINSKVSPQSDRLDVEGSSDIADNDNVSSGDSMKDYANDNVEGSGSNDGGSGLLPDAGDDEDSESDSDELNKCNSFSCQFLGDTQATCQEGTCQCSEGYSLFGIFCEAVDWDSNDKCQLEDVINECAAVDATCKRTGLNSHVCSCKFPKIMLDGTCALDPSRNPTGATIDLTLPWSGLFLDGSMHLIITIEEIVLSELDVLFPDAMPSIQSITRGEIAYRQQENLLKVAFLLNLQDGVSSEKLIENLPSETEKSIESIPGASLSLGSIKISKVLLKCSRTNTCTGGTDQLANCVDTEEGPMCTCSDGFKDINGICQDVDECAEGTDKCSLQDEKASCSNEDGYYTCACSSDFEGVYKGCIRYPELNPCQNTSVASTCRSKSASCKRSLDAEDGFECRCQYPFVKAPDGGSCVSIRKSSYQAYRSDLQLSKPWSEALESEDSFEYQMLKKNVELLVKMMSNNVEDVYVKSFRQGPSLGRLTGTVIANTIITSTSKPAFSGNPTSLPGLGFSITDATFSALSSTSGSSSNRPSSSNSGSESNEFPGSLVYLAPSPSETNDNLYELTILAPGPDEMPIVESGLTILAPNEDQEATATSIGVTWPTRILEILIYLVRAFILSPVYVLYALLRPLGGFRKKKKKNIIGRRFSTLPFTLDDILENRDFILRSLRRG